MSSRLLVVIGGTLVFTLGVLFYALPHPPGTTNGQVKLVTAENFWGDIARQIGGGHVSVTSIITDPNADPHLYESNANNASAVASADIVIENGLGYDDFFDKLLQGSRNDHRTQLSAAKILNVTADGANPHLWYDLPRVHLVAQQIESALVSHDPTHKADYEANLATFDQSLTPLLNLIDQLKQTYPGAAVAYTEPVPAYLLTDAGLSVKTPEGFAEAIEEGNDPSPSDTTAMDNLMTGHGVRVLLYNSQATSPVTQHVRDLAAQTGIPVVGVTETLPAGAKSYQNWQLSQLEALSQALAK